MIEKAQDQIAERYDFRVLRHRHELYGHCAKCRSETARRTV
jgi:Fe2+ or Zn2+ uptake regulation protein